VVGAPRSTLGALEERPLVNCWGGRSGFTAIEGDDEFSVLSASTGAEAIDLLGRSRADVVLLDVVLPDTRGYDICRTVRSGDGINDL
jgi:DNA-binding response OmpR family regulator